MPQTRRTFVRNTGIGLLGFCVAGCRVDLSPEQAKLQNLAFQVLGADEVRGLEALGETLLPGSAAAGLAHYIDHQLDASPLQQMLMIKYLGASPPFAPFYSAGLAALDGSAAELYDAAFAELRQEQRTAMVGQMARQDPPGWSGPPAPFFYFVLRSDAVDVVYGTKAGTESLGFPYMAHIEPPSRWGE